VELIENGFCWVVTLCCRKTNRINGLEKNIYDGEFSGKVTCHVLEAKSDIERSLLY